MIDDIIVIDNVIPVKAQEQLKDFFFSKKPNWIFFRDIALSETDIKRRGITKLTPGIGCYIKQDYPKFVDEPLLNLVKPIPQRACETIGGECLDIFNVRSFMHFPLHQSLRKEYDNPHIDVRYDHLVVLYYVNDTDGDTFIFDKTFEDYSELPENAIINIIKKVSPKMGRVVVFNGNQYHSSSTPTKDVRCIINFNVNFKINE